MGISLDVMIRAFELCLKRWQVDALLKVEKINPLQNIQGRRPERREAARIFVSENIAVKRKERGTFMELFGTTVIEFHADWSGFENPEYTGSYADMQRGVSSEIGGEKAVAKIVDQGGGIAASFSFQGAWDFSSTVNLILDQMELSSSSKQTNVDLSAVSSIVKDLKDVVASWSGASKEQITEIIRRIERIVAR